MENIFKKYLKRFLKKFLNKNSRSEYQKNYLFYRWLASIAEDKKQTENICIYFALWMTKNNKQNNQFNDIFVIDDVIYLFTDRPGIWIGKHGDDIESLNKYINDKYDTEYKIRIIESTVNNSNWVKVNLALYTIANDY